MTTDEKWEQFRRYVLEARARMGQEPIDREFARLTADLQAQRWALASPEVQRAELERLYTLEPK